MSSRTVLTAAFLCIAGAATFVFVTSATPKNVASVPPLAPVLATAPAPPCPTLPPPTTPPAPPKANPGAVMVPAGKAMVEDIKVPCTKTCAPGSSCSNDVCFCDNNHYGRRCQEPYGVVRGARDQEHINSRLYFTSPTAQSRQQLAAANLMHCPSILEVGGLFAGTLPYLARAGWTGNYTQMDMFGPQVANVTRTTYPDGETRVRRVVKTRQLCGENQPEEAQHSCFVFVGIPPDYSGLRRCAGGVHAAKYQTVIVEGAIPNVFNLFADALRRSPEYTNWGITADWTEDLQKNGVQRNFPKRTFRVFSRKPKE